MATGHSTSFDERSRIHQESLETTLTRVWLAMVAILGGQWTWLAVAETPSTTILVIGFALLAAQIAGATIATLRIQWAGSATGIQLVLAVGAAIALMDLAFPFDALGPHNAVGDGLLLLLEPALVSYAAFGPRARLALPSSVVVSIAAWLAWRMSEGPSHFSLIPIEQGVSGLGDLVMVWGVVRLLRRAAGAADQLSDRTALWEAQRHAEETAIAADRHIADMIHDVILDSLRILAQPGPAANSSGTTSVVERAIRGLRNTQIVTDSRLPPVNVEQAVRAEIDQWSAGMPIVVDIAGSAVAPAHVAAAYVDALAECLRNIDRHAAATRTTVSLHVDDLIRLTVSDDGAGFDTSARRSGHRGVDQSIIGRFRAIGGTATVQSAVGAGTTVVMEWADPDPGSLQGLDDSDDSGWNWVRRLGLSPRLVWLTYFAPELIVTAVFAVLHLPDARVPPAALSVLCAQFALSAYGARAAARLSLGRFAGLALLVATVALVTLGVGIMAPGRPDGFTYWAIGGSVNAITVIAVLRPLGESMASTAILIAAIDVLVTHSSVGGTIGTYAIIILGVAVGIAHRRAFARLTPLSENYLARLAESASATERRRAIAFVENQRLEPVRRRVLPFLLAAGEQTHHQPSDAELTRAASELGHWARQHLLHPEFIDMQVSALLETLGRRGVLTDIAGDPPRGRATVIGRLALSIAAAEPTARRITLSFVATPSDETDMRLVLVADAIADSTAAALSALDPTLQVTTVSEQLLLAQWQPAEAVAVSDTLVPSNRVG